MPCEEGESLPYPISGRRRDIDGQSSGELQDLNTQHQGHVGDLSYLLPDVLILCGFLEVFGLRYFVHKSQDFPACAAACVPGGEHHKGTQIKHLLKTGILALADYSVHAQSFSDFYIVQFFIILKKNKFAFLHIAQ